MIFGRSEPHVRGSKVDTYIGRGTKADGTLEATGTVRIDGTVDGAIRADGDVIVGEGGVVKATIAGMNVMVAGEVRSNVTARGRLDIAPTGIVIGDVRASGFTVEDGAVFIGKCEMTGNGQHQPKALPPKSKEPDHETQE